MVKNLKNSLVSLKWLPLPFWSDQKRKGQLPGVKKASW